MQLLGQGAPLEKIRRNLQELRDSCADFERPLAQLRIIVDDSELLSFVSQNRRMNAQGQILFGFDADTGQIDPKTSQEWFEHGAMLEEQRKLPEAARAYTKAIELNYELPEALFRLGNVYRAMGDLRTAERFYRQALEQSPALASAW